MHGLSSRSRPGLLNASDSGYPWLADSWPTTSLPVNSGSGGPNDLNNFGRGGKSTLRPVAASAWNSERIKLIGNVVSRKFQMLKASPLHASAVRKWCQGVNGVVLMYTCMHIAWAVFGHTHLFIVCWRQTYMATRICCHTETNVCRSDPLSHRGEG